MQEISQKSVNCVLGMRKVSMKLNLGAGTQKIDGYISIGLDSQSDIKIDFEETQTLPFEDNSVDVIVSMSMFEYLYPATLELLIKDVYRVLKPNGIVRIGTVDLLQITRFYIQRDKDFFYQQNRFGRDRFIGRTISEKFNQWFGSQLCDGKSSKFIYDYELMELLFKQSPFQKIEEKKYQESAISEIKQIDNRPCHFFYLEAVK